MFPRGIRLKKAPSQSASGWRYLRNFVSAPKGNAHIARTAAPRLKEFLETQQMQHGQGLEVLKEKLKIQKEELAQLTLAVETLTRQVEGGLAAVPHGPRGKLIPLVLTAAALVQAREEAKELPELVLNASQINDLELLLSGSLSPLTGYLDRSDYTTCIQSLRLQSGVLWPWPLVLLMDEYRVRGLEVESSVVLQDQERNSLAILDITDIWRPDGVSSMALGGRLRGLQLPTRYGLQRTRPSGPVEARRLMAGRHWHKVAGRVCRSPMQTAAFDDSLGVCERLQANLQLQIRVPESRSGFDSTTLLKSFGALMSCYPDGLATLQVCPLPSLEKENLQSALLTAIVSKNYGCSHVLVAQSELSIPFKDLKAFETELGVVFEEVPGNPRADQAMLASLEANSECLETEYPSPVAHVLQAAYPPRLFRGYCVFFTGLSGSGKSSIAVALRDTLLELDDRPVTVLDGDHVRQMLASELGFSEEHRNLNIRRLGYVAGQITKARAAVIAAPIAPYRQSREHARKSVEQSGRALFFEIHVDTPLEMCMLRDKKGVYKKAISGLLKNFTGVDDPYEPPTHPALRINSAEVSIGAAVQLIVDLLRREQCLP